MGQRGPYRLQLKRLVAQVGLNLFVSWGLNLT
jgi:hypothetical protein